MGRLRILLLLSLLGSSACGDDGLRQADAGPAAVDSGWAPTPRGHFPDGFLWGTTTAPYQVEGQLHDTDWFQWETSCTDCSGDKSDEGPNFWQLYDSDFANAEEISNSAVRIGIEWSRVFPTAEQFSQLDPDLEALSRYHDIVTAARARGLTVMVSLIHFTLPVWLHNLDDSEQANGWEDDSIVAKVAAYAGWAATEFGADVDYWITMNEPLTHVVRGWIGGSFPPGKQWQIKDGLRAAENMIWAHARAYDAIHQADVVDSDGDSAAAKVSVAKHNRVYLAKDEHNPAHVRAAELLRYFLNGAFLQAVVFGNLDRNFDFDFTDEGDLMGDPSLVGRMDFIGLNYRGITLVVETANENNFPMIGVPLFNDLDNQGLEEPVSDFGQTIYPQGLRLVLDELEPYDLPIIITENGVADATDTVRPRFLVEHLYAVNRAIDDGIDIRGYFYRSLMDHFEWSSGFCPRFGLFHVNLQSDARTRTMGEGAEVYRRIIDDNTVSPDLFKVYPRYEARGFCTREQF